MVTINLCKTGLLKIEINMDKIRSKTITHQNFRTTRLGWATLQSTEYFPKSLGDHSEVFWQNGDAFMFLLLSSGFCPLNSKACMNAHIPSCLSKIM